ncbi:unnamed protein product [Calypogeia fissa]
MQVNEAIQSDDDDLVIDATEKGNIRRPINHSIWEVTREDGKETHHIMLIARMDVAAGEELTYNYRFAPEEKRFCAYVEHLLVLGASTSKVLFNSVD